MRAELDAQQPALVGELHRRAAAWYEGAGLTVQAVTAATAAQDWQRAASAAVLGLAVETMLAGQDSARLDAALAGMPGREPGAMPVIVRAARAMGRFDLDACHDELPLSTKQPPATPADEASLGGCAAVGRAILSRAQGDVDSAEAALTEGERELARVPDQADHPPGEAGACAVERGQPRSGEVRGVAPWREGASPGPALGLTRGDALHGVLAPAGRTSLV